MKKIIAFIVLIYMAFSLESFSCDKQQKTTKQLDIEQTSKRRANSRVLPSGKKTQKNMQKQRIKNHNQKKTNNMWKK
jgi:hypothetical protein